MNEKFPKLHLTVGDGASGLEIRALLGKKYNCVEFTMKDDVPQQIFFSPWIQFEPTELYEDREKIALEMVRRYNTHDRLIEELDKERKRAKSWMDETHKFKQETYDYFEKLKELHPGLKLP